jgi:hypothetical protein
MIRKRVDSSQVNNIVDISDATDKKKNKKECLDGDIKMASLVLILIRS